MSALDSASKAGLIVDLDALFDTRLTVLEQISPQLAAYHLLNGYVDRESDDFKYCPIELFKKVYAMRDEKILEESIMTKVKEIVIDFMRDAIKVFGTDRNKTRVNVYINVWPYKISADAAGLMLKPFYDAVDGNANIHMVNIPPGELTPDVCKEHFSYVIKYDYMDWLVTLGELNLIQNNTMQGVTLVGPRLYQSGMPADIEIDEESRNQPEHYQCTEFFFAPFVKLELYISRLFSAEITDGFLDRLLTAIDKAQADEKNNPTIDEDE